MALSVVGIPVAWIPIWAGIVLYKAASETELAVQQGSSGALAEAVNKVGRYFKICSISYLVSLVAFPVIILTIATIAIPSLLRSRQLANESAAVAELRTVNHAEIEYRASFRGQYGTIPQLIRVGLLDSRFDGVLSGYRYNISANGEDYTATAI